MPKFSIIVPVYNVEKYLKKCLDSINNQTFNDYEVIIVNDGSTDNSKDILKEYDFKIINQDNQGLSMARNNGVKEATGEYLLFLDSDDYWEKDLLEKLNESTNNNPDLIRFQLQEVYDDGKIIKYNEKEFNNLNGEEAFKEILNYHFIEVACIYAIKREYYLKENFEFKKDLYHEDFGLIPLVIIKSNIVNSINYIGYNYLQRTGSIMNNDDYNKTIKKVDDFYNHYKYIKEEVNKTNIDKTYINSFIANCFILKICSLKNKEYKKYKRILKEEKVYNFILTNTIPRKIKKILLKISPKLYYRIIK